MDFMLELGDDFPLLVGSEGYALMTTGFGSIYVFPPPFTLPANRRFKSGQIRYSDAGQMNMYLNYAKEHWTYRMKIHPSVWFSVRRKESENALCTDWFA